MNAKRGCEHDVKNSIKAAWQKWKDLAGFGAVHKVRHAILDQFVPSLCHTLSHISGPP